MIIDYDDDFYEYDDVEDIDDIQEAHAGGKALKDAGYKFDVAHTSVLQVMKLMMIMMMLIMMSCVHCLFSFVPLKLIVKK